MFSVDFKGSFIIVTIYILYSPLCLLGINRQFLYNLTIRGINNKNILFWKSKKTTHYNSVIKAVFLLIDKKVISIKCRYVIFFLFCEPFDYVEKF